MPVVSKPREYIPRIRTTLTEEEVEQVEKLSSVLNTEQMANFFGIQPRLFDDILARDQFVRDAYDKGRATALAAVGRGILQKALEGNVTCMIYYTKAQGGWRDQDQKLELTGKGGGPIETKDLSDDPLGVITRRIAGIAARIRAGEVVEELEPARKQISSS